MTKSHPNMLKGIIFIAITLLTFCLQAQDNGMAQTRRQWYDFEACSIADAFSAESAKIGMAYVGGGSRLMVVDGEAAIEGKSLRVNAADMRQWSLNYNDRIMAFAIDILCDDHFKDTNLYVCAQNHQKETSTETANGGRLIVIAPAENGAPALFDYSGKKLCALSRGKAHRIEARIAYGSNTYSLTVDGVRVSADSVFAGAVYAVYGLKVYAVSQSPDSYVVMDNLHAYTLGRAYPQANSYQAPGPLPVVQVPERQAVDGVEVYVGRQLLPRPARNHNGSMMLPVKETLSAADWHGPQTIHTDYAPAQKLAALLNAKVWYAKALNMIVVTTGKAKNDDVLRSIGGTFWMNGQPYYELSFNKWDLCNQIANDPTFNDGQYPSRSWNTSMTTLPGAEAALKELSANGFRTIRVFCTNINPGKSPQERDRFFRIHDTMYDLCDKYGIRVIPCLGLTSTEFLAGRYAEGAGWVNDMESMYDLIVDKNSKSRKNVYDFIDLYVSRYRGRKSIFMWEICNEGNLHADVGSGSSINYSLLQLGSYYADVAKRIRRNDPERLVTGGDGLLRSAQWNLLKAVLEGRPRDFTVDTHEERLAAMWLLHGGLDVISIHGYQVGQQTRNGHSNYCELTPEGKKTHLVTWEFILKNARRIGLPVYNGEVGGTMAADGSHLDAPNASSEAAKGRARYLQTLIDAGVQLSHWWAFRSDRVNFGMDMDTWSVTIDGTPETFVAIKAANEALQKRYIVNGLEE